MNQKVEMKSAAATVRNMQEKQSGLRSSDLWDLRQSKACIITRRGGAAPQRVRPSQKKMRVNVHLISSLEKKHICVAVSAHHNAALWPVLVFLIQKDTEH